MPTSCMRLSPKKRRSAIGQGEGRRVVMTQQLQGGELFCGLLPAEMVKSSHRYNVKTGVKKPVRTCSRHCTSKHSPQACTKACRTAYSGNASRRWRASGSTTQEALRKPVQKLQQLDEIDEREKKFHPLRLALEVVVGGGETRNGPVRIIATRQL